MLDMCEPDLASLSAFSFPLMSKWPGHHVKAKHMLSYQSSRSRIFSQNVSKLVWSSPGLPWNIHWIAPVLLVDMMIFNGGELLFMIMLCIIYNAASRAFISTSYASTNSPSGP